MARERPDLRRATFDMCLFFQAEDGIRDYKVTGVQTCALPISFYSQPGCQCSSLISRQPLSSCSACKNRRTQGITSISETCQPPFVSQCRWVLLASLDRKSVV